MSGGTTGCISAAVMEERLARLYKVLRHRAAQKERAPTRTEVAEMFGLAPTGNVKRYFDLLERRGLIRVETSMSSRVVTIVETGEHTLRIQRAIGDAGRAAGRNCPPSSWHTTDYDTPEKVAERQAARDAESARIARLITPDRSPCPVCGVRGDIEHSHRRRA